MQICFSRYPEEVSLGKIFLSPVAKQECLTTLEVVQTFSMGALGDLGPSIGYLCNGKTAKANVHLPNLRELTLDHIRFSSDELLEIPKEHKGLRSLKLRQVHLPEPAIDSIQHMTQLEALDLSGVMVCIEPEPVAKLPIGGYDVEATPSLRDEEFSDIHASILKPLKRLTSLDMSMNSIGDATIQYIAPLTYLLSLKLEGTRVTDDGVHRLSNLVHLRHLSLSHVDRIFQNSYERNEWLTNFSSLVALELNGTKATDAISSSLSDLTNLQHLDLGGTSIGTATVRCLSCLQNLVTINLAGVELEATGLNIFSQIETLRSVKLREEDLWLLDEDKYCDVNFLPVQGSGSSHFDFVDTLIDEIFDESETLAYRA